MFQPPRVCYVTITNWGVGDDLAMRGAMGLMRTVLPGHLTFCAEKNEAMRKMAGAHYKWDIWNSALHAPDVDLIVHAGGNQWSGPNHAAWEDRIIAKKTPVIYLGVGMWSNRASKDKARKVLEHCRLFVGRDEVACQAASDLGAKNVHLLCCPSLFIEPAAPLDGDRVGLVYQAHGVVGPHSVKTELAEAEVALYRRVCDKRPSLIICHFIGDFVSALNAFPEWEDRIVYSKVLDDYIGWYRSCNRIVSMRLHGACLGVTLGRPTVCIKAGETRVCAMKQIAVPVIEPSMVSTVEMSQFSKPSETEVLKAYYLGEYLRLLKGAVA